MNINQLFENFVGGGSTPDTTPNNQTKTQNNGGGITDMLGQFTNGPAGGFAGGLATGGLLGTLIGNKKMRKKAGKMAGGAVGYGGSAVLGAMALKAYQNWQSKSAAPASAATAASTQRDPAPPLASPESFDPAINKDATGQPMQLTLIKSMIAAANADGHMDQKEQAAVFDAVEQMSLDGEAKALVFDMMRSPPTIEEIAGYAKGMEQASEIYLASRLAIDPDEPSEQKYLHDLSKALGVPDALVREIESQFEPEKEPTSSEQRMAPQFGRDAA